MVILKKANGIHRSAPSLLNIKRYPVDAWLEHGGFLFVGGGETCRADEHSLPPEATSPRMTKPPITKLDLGRDAKASTWTRNISTRNLNQ
jgi:hypothetical protein